MRLLIDMNLSPRWVGALAAEQIVAVHWSTIGAAVADDRTIMAAARESGDVVLTHDLDFGAILATSGAIAPSVMQLRGSDVSPEAALPAVVQAVRQCADDLLAGALLTVDARRFRVALLPLRTN